MELIIITIEKLNNNKTQIATPTTVVIMALIWLLCIPNYTVKLGAIFA